jgi:Septum formation
MRGFRRSAAAVAVATGLALTGCTTKPSANEAQPSTAPSPSASAPSAPMAGECHNLDFIEQVSVVTDPAVPCDGVHIGETVGVGEFTGDAAAAAKAPLLVEGATDAAAATQNSAYQDCSAKADGYLGSSWIHPMLSLRIVLPDDASWQAGQRWYRCDLYEIVWNEGDLEKRTRSLKTLPIGAACFDLNTQNNRQLNCSEKHSGEFVGGFMLPATLKKEPKTEKEYKPYYARCQKLIAAYIGVAESKVPSIVGMSFWWQFDSTFWPSGRRAAWCFLYTGESGRDEVTGSAKGGKGKGL